MATITSQSGTTNFSGEVEKGGKPLQTEESNKQIQELTIRASASISAALKVIVITGYYSGTGLTTGATLSSLAQIVLGISQAAIGSGATGDLITKGILTTTLDGSAKAIGDPIYSTNAGVLSFTPSAVLVGYLLETTTNAKIFVKI